MAVAIWTAAAGGRRIKGLASDAPSAAEKAAYALLDLFAEANDLPTWVEFFETHEKSFHSRFRSSRELGMELATAAIDGAPSWMTERFSVPTFEVIYSDGDLIWEGEASEDVGVQMGRQNPPWRPIGVEAGGRYQTYYRDGRKSWAFEDGVLASDWAKEIKGRVEDRGPGGYTHYGRQNPVGDRVDVMQGPGRGRSGVVESETKHVARVRFDRGGGAGHLERSALRTRGRSRD